MTVTHIQALNLCELFSRAVQLTPNHVAVEHEEATLTYQELDSVSGALASHLAELKVGPTSKVPLLTSLGAWNVVAILGILKTGACYVPLDRTTWSRDRIDQVLKVIDSKVIVNTTTESLNMTDGHEVHLGDATLVQALRAHKVSFSRQEQIEEDDLACIIFTSGSTGKPKGVMIRHCSVANYAQTSPFNMDVEAGDRVLHILSVAFDASTGMLFSILGNSGTVIPACIDSLHEKATTCTILASTPSILATLLVPTATLNPYKLVRTILLGGETPPQHLLAPWLAQSVRILNAYGPTETMCASLMQEVEVCTRTNSIHNAIVGRAMAHCPAYLVDPTTMEAIEDDDEVEGEIFISGCGLARGYYNDPDRTAASFIQWNGVRVYRTGDYARWTRRNDGARVMEFRGRSDRTVKNRGFLVNLENDVERPIAQMQGLGVTNVCATMVQGHLAAVVTPQCVDVTLLHQKLRSTLSAFHIPDHMEAVDELPLSANGKVDLKAVAAMVELHLSSSGGLDDSSSTEVGETKGNVSRAAKMARCMKEALGLSQQHCLEGSSDFFELGGNSLKVLKLSTLCRSHGLMLMPKDVYFGKTLAALVARATSLDGEIGDNGRVGLTGEEGQQQQQEQADMRVSVAKAMGVEVGEIEAVGPLTTLQLELVSSTMACEGKNTVQVRRFYEAKHAAMLRSAWHRVCDIEPLFRTEIALHLPCGPVQVQRSRASPCKQQLVERVFCERQAYECAVSAASLSVGLGQRLDMFSYRPQSHADADADADTDADAETTLIWTIHHALIDGFSQALVFAQAERAVRGEALVPSASFIHAAAVLRQLHQARDADARAFWTSHLKGVTPRTPGVRPTGRGQPASIAPSVRATELFFSLPAPDAAHIVSFARAHRTTVATLHYVAWALAHASLSQSPTVVVGVVVSGRETQPYFQHVVGPTMATLPLVVRLGHGTPPPLQQLLDSTMTSLVHMAEFAWSTPDQISPDWRVSNVLAEQHGFCAHTHQVAQLRPSQAFDNTAFPLNLLADGDATFRIVFDIKVHSIAAVSRLRDGFMRAIQALLRDDIATCLPNPQQKLGQPDKTMSSLHNTLTQFARGPPQTVKMALERSAIEHADLVALESMTVKLTYAELNCQAEIVAHHIRQCMPGARVVAIHADGSLNWIIGIFAILKAGCAYCPLDPAYPLQRRATVYKQSSAAGLLLPCRDQGHEIPVPGRDPVIVVDDVRAQAVPQDMQYPTSLHDDQSKLQQSEALIVFTSGTTGEPKGVPISNRGLLALQSNREATMFSQPGRRIAQVMSPAFDYCANEILSALLHGGTLVLKNPNDSLAHLSRVDAATFTPSMMAVLDPDQYPNLRIIYATGEPVAPGLVDLWAPGRLFYNAYGPAECSICTSFTRLTPGSAVTIGRPIRTARMYLLDDNLDQIVEPGVVGEIFLAGIQVMPGYINAPQKSERCILPDPWHKGERMYRTGDYGTYTANGCITYIGRVDRQIKLRGYRIELAAIEQKIYQLDPSIMLATVLVANDTLVAFVKPAAVNIESLSQRLKENLQPTWVPHTIIPIDDMPMTANGKVNSKALEAMAVDARKRRVPNTNDKGSVLEDNIQRRIAQEWKAVLNIDRNEEPSSCEDFLSLGGHSVLQMLLAVRLSKIFGVAISTSDVIRSPTIRGQASIIRSRTGSKLHEVQPLGKNELSPLEVQMWRSHHAATSATTFSIPVLLQLSGSFDRCKFITALNNVLRSRDILRSNFTPSDCGPIRTLRSVPPHVLEVRVLDIFSEINIPFDLAHDELIRVLFHRESDTLLIVASHAITDLNSIQSVLRETSSVYATNLLPTPRMRYLNAPGWSRPVQTSDMTFWSKYLSNTPPRLDTLLKLPAPSPKHVFEGTSRFQTFHGSPVKKLTKLLPVYGITHHHLAITVAAQALQWLTDTNDVILGCPFQNRVGDLEQESVGLFLDRLPIRIQTSSPTTTTKDLLRATRDTSQQAIAAALPFRNILSALGIEANDPLSPCSHPIFQAMVTFHLKDAVESCLNIPGCDVRRPPPMECWASGSKFLLMFEWTEISADTWVLRIEYDCHRIELKMIQKLERAVDNILLGLSEGKTRESIFKMLL